MSGEKWALGVVAALAVAGLARQGSRNIPGPYARSGSGNCGMCGDGLGSRDVTPEDRAYALVNNLGSHLYQSRFDARANFLIPMAERERLNSSRVAFLQDKWRESLMAMGARRVEMKPGKQRVEKVVGTLRWTRKMAALDAEQKRALEAMGVGPLVKGARQETPTQSAPLSPLMPLKIYAEAKQKDRQKDTNRSVAGGYTPIWQGKYLVAYYVSQLYAERAWTLYVLRTTGFGDRSRRKPAFSMGKADPGVLAGVSVELVLPAEVPEVSPVGVYQVLRHRHWAGKADPDIQPRLYLVRGGLPMALYNVSGSGSMAGFATGKVGTSCFTATSKMSAPSFSLPAGELKAGGTCVFAGMAAQKQFGEDVVICRRCYATGANYGYAEAMLAGETRYRWAITRLASGGAAKMAPAFVAAISSYARDAKFPARRTQEIGVWQGGRLVYQKGVKTKAPLADTDLTRAAAELGMPRQIRNTRDFFADRGVPEGQIAGFFRIHDSGDFTISRYQPAYIEAWGEVAAALPYLQFWAPTRIWARQRSLSNLRSAERQWVRAGFAAGRRVFTQGSAAVLTPKQFFLHRRSQTLDPTEALAQHGEELLVGEQAAPGEEEARLEGAGSDFTYLPNMGVVRLLMKLTSRLRNFAIRPSALYVKTPDNPAYIPYVTDPLDDRNNRPYGGGANALTAGSGVNTKWVGKHSLDLEVAVARGLDPAGYIPVYDNRGVRAYQCPVYSQMIPDKKGGLDKDTGLVKMVEATSCQSAGCRACWLALDRPITYGYH